MNLTNAHSQRNSLKWHHFYYCSRYDCRRNIFCVPASVTSMIMSSDRGSFTLLVQDKKPSRIWPVHDKWYLFTCKHLSFTELIFKSWRSYKVPTPENCYKYFIRTVYTGTRTKTKCSRTQNYQYILTYKKIRFWDKRFQFVHLNYPGLSPPD